MAAYFSGRKMGEKTWHISQPLPKIEDRVVTIQADGDELVAILRGLGQTSPIPGERFIGGESIIPIKK